MHVTMDGLADFARWLDSEGLFEEPAEQDSRTPEQLAEEWTKQRRREADEGTVPQGFAVENSLLLEDALAQAENLRDLLRTSEDLRAQYERRMNDRAHYVPREELDAMRRRWETLDQAYVKCRADHLKFEAAYNKEHERIAAIKALYGADMDRMRGKLQEAYAVLAGTWPPVSDEELAQVLHNQMQEVGFTVSGAGWASLAAEKKALWVILSANVRARVAGNQREALSYGALSKAYGDMASEMSRLEYHITQTVPGYDMAGQTTVEAAINLITIGKQFGDFTVNVARSVWPPVQTMLLSLGYELQGGEWRRAEEFDVPEETNGEQSAEDAARAMAQELGRLSEFLASKGVPLRNGPVHGAEVDTAINVMEDQRMQIYNLRTQPSLGLAYTRQLLEELRARGEMESGTSTEEDVAAATKLYGTVQALLDTLPVGILQYRTADEVPSKRDHDWS